MILLRGSFIFVVFISAVLILAIGSASAFTATDPGVRGGPAGAGEQLPGLDANQTAFFLAGQAAFTEVEAVPNGLGPRFNADSCVVCHSFPDVGGASPFENPLFEVATKNSATNIVPFFIQPDGPIREARFIYNPDGTRDGGVHNLFTITGRQDAPGCNISQPDFLAAAKKHNVIFCIPISVFGAGLKENIPDHVIINNMNADLARKRALNISGHPNYSGNDGTITKFGWKAQNKSPLMFAGEAYNVEMGVSNELFTQERDETKGCQFNPLPEDRTNLLLTNPPTAVPSDIVLFSLFMQMLAPPTPAPDTPSIINGRTLFGQVGCTMCHTPTLKTGTTGIAALSNQPVNLYSDLLLHNMGLGLADNIVQGGAGPAEFRTAPLWGLGQRIFLLHDGKTTDLRHAINEHASNSSEANRVISVFNQLTEAQKQNILDFLRSL